MKILTLFVLASVLLAGCTGNASPPSPSEDVPATPPGKLVEITVTAKNWDFTPGVITVKKGDTVRLTLRSIEGTHGFSLPAFGINERLEAGAPPKIVEFLADKTGEFDFRCSVMCGKGHMGQKGKLVVLE
jgi:cytochrome c oxidase subunit 2